MHVVLSCFVSFVSFVGTYIALSREFPTQMASNAEKVSIWWRHHGLSISINHCAVLFGDVIAPCHASPSHQKVWYRLCMITGSLSSTRRDFNHLIFVTIKQWYKILIYICVLKSNSTQQGLFARRRCEKMHAMKILISQHDTMQCCYNAADVLQNLHKSLLWIKTLTYILPKQLQVTLSSLILRAWHDI